MKILLLTLAFMQLLVAAEYKYEAFGPGNGKCVDWVNIPNSARLSPEHPLYDSDPIKECMNRCLAAVGERGVGDNQFRKGVINNKAFYVRNSNNECACSTGSCNDPLLYTSEFKSYRILPSNFCDRLANNLGGTCTETTEGSFTLATSNGLHFGTNAGFDNDGGGYYLQNICLLALYGENAVDYTSKGKYRTGSFVVGGGFYSHIHGISNGLLSSSQTMSGLGLFLGPKCCSSWSSMTCTFTGFLNMEDYSHELIEDGICDDAAQLNDAARLSKNDPLYDSDAEVECKNRCLDAVGKQGASAGDGVIWDLSFYIQVSTGACGCASGRCQIPEFNPPGFKSFRILPLPVHECANNDCQNNSVCVEGTDEYFCTCLDGFEGDRCEIDIDECANNDCQNNSVCVDAINGYSCTCVDGYSGDRCELKQCVCTNGDAVALGDASCEVHGAERCQNCDPGYTVNASLSCDKNICLDKPIDAIEAACFCAGHTPACPVNDYCYDGVCVAVPKQCVCTNGEAVALGDASCDVHGAERCQNCEPGYKISASLSCDKNICLDKPIHAINEACFCAGHTASCAVDNYCYDAVCVDVPKYPTCTNDAYYKQSATCACGTGAAATQCNVGRFCSNGVCSDAASCHVRSDIAKRAFYGAHLDGSWDSDNRKMTISLPVSSHITINSITWNQASDPEALRYLPSIDNLWNVDRTDTCQIVYQLTVPQATFFGLGSHFVLNGTHMKTTLRVHAEEEIHQRVGTHDYTYEREITNTVPLLVELTKRTTVTAKFKTTVPPPAKKTIKLEMDGTNLTDAQKDELLAQCTAKYNQGGKVVCERVIIDSDGKIKIEIDITETGSKSDLEDVLDDVEENGYETPGYVAPVIKEIPHEEFVFLIGAEDNYEDTGMKTVSMVMEIHGRTCVNHTLADDTGVRYTSGASDYIDESIAKTSFVWKTVDGGDEIEQKFEYGLCVETLTWTFAPKGYVIGTYEIGLEFTLAGDDMGTFTTEAEIELDQADVIADIGFTDIVKTYTGPECTDDQKAESFHIGDKFYAKISLGDMVVNAERITCETATLTQTRGSESKLYDLREEDDDRFKFYQSATTGNSVVCGAELKAPLFASVDGYHTNVDFGILVDYEVGNGADSGRRILRARLSADEPEARQYRDPEQDNLSIDMKLLAAKENAVGVESYLLSSNTNAIPGALFLAGVGFSYVVYKIVYKKQEGEYSPLLEI